MIWGKGKGPNGKTVIFAEEPNITAEGLVITGPMPAILREDVWTKAGFSLFPAGKLSPCHRARVRPVPAGVSVCGCSETACSATGPFTDGKSVYLLTNAHCVVKDEYLSQPGPSDGGKCPGDVIGRVVKTSDINADGYTDTALVAVRLDEISPTICGLDVVFNGKYKTPQVGDRLLKSGRTTGVAECEVVAVDADVKVNYGDHIREVKGVTVTTACLQPGDSGSVAVYPDGTFAGQGFAGSPFISLFISPDKIAQEFGVVPWRPEPAGAAVAKSTLVVLEQPTCTAELDLKPSYLATPGDIVLVVKATCNGMPISGRRISLRVGDREYQACAENGYALFVVKAEPGAYQLTAELLDRC